MSRELLKRVLMARTIGYPLPPSIVKEIEAELAKDMPEPDYRRVLKEINEFIIDQPEGTDSLYAHTAQQKPLSDDEIIEIGKLTRSVENSDFLPVAFARAIEQAHGIIS